MKESHSRFSSVVGRSLWVFSISALSACAPALGQTAASSATRASPQNGTEWAQAMADASDKGTLKVTGQAQITLPADRVTLALAVETEASSAREASALNAGRMDEVLRALKDAGTEGMKIETFGYSLSPQYRRPTPQNPSDPVIVGYRALNNIRVTLDEVGGAGEILDLGITAGANRVMSLRFSASSTHEARLEALRGAVRSAREEAEAMAEAAGVGLGPILEIQGGASAQQPRTLYRTTAAMEMAAPDTPVEAGAQTVSANVTVIFRILERGR